MPPANSTHTPSVDPGGAIRAVIFDFDGVIVHSEPLHCRSFRDVAASVGIDLSEAEYYRELIGFDDRGAWKRIFELHDRVLDESTLSTIMRRKGDVIRHLIRSGEYHALPGVTELVASLRARGISIAICSGALRDELIPMLDGIGLMDAFNVITTAEDVVVGKPDPRCYVLTASRLAEKIGSPLTVESCLIIEDAPIVAVRARAGGFNVLGVTTTYAANMWPRDIQTVSSLASAEIIREFPRLLDAPGNQQQGEK